ncbi:hypothetical protein Cpir12675_003211 [Ceratocystis pirilliformis]|uniref:NAD(+) kinase n=1 Tax=Ceratocystis pirilliformis TaxID=259994 RepID=A0ABR3Z5N5_9PEZI
MSHTPTENGQRSDGDDLVEVQFNPTGIHRRKSSLVNTENPRPLTPDKHSARQHHQSTTGPRPACPRMNRAPTECIVHQFLESQQRARDAEAHREEVSRDAGIEDSVTDGEATASETDGGVEEHEGSNQMCSDSLGSEDDDPYTSHHPLPYRLHTKKHTRASSTNTPDDTTFYSLPQETNYLGGYCGQPDEQVWVGAMSKPRVVTPGQSRRSSPPEINPTPSALEPQEPIDRRPRKKIAVNKFGAHEMVSGLDDKSASTSANSKPKLKFRSKSRTKTKLNADIDAAVAAADPTSLHSRHLTKSQLTDMVWGVRELSRRLGSVRIKARVRSIFVLTKIHDVALLVQTRNLVHWLLHPARGARYVVYVEEKLAAHRRFDAVGLRAELVALHEEAGDQEAAVEIGQATHGRLRLWTASMCRDKPENFDFCITLGGDGTVLYAGWLFQRVVPPVLTFSLGSLGFLAKFDFAKFEDTLTQAFTHGVVVSLRLRFECTVMRTRARHPLPADASPKLYEEELERLQMRDLVEELVGEERDDQHTHRPDGTFEILNEVVVDRGPNPTMSYTEIFGDNEHFTSVLADGVCVSTPTGSTAYNLAAGGSLCHPDNPVMLVTSICAHALSFRPIILPDTVVLRIGVPYDARTSSWVSFDGRERVELQTGDYVTISASRYPFASVLAGGGGRSEDWVNSIRGKLGWNTRQKQKALDQSWEKD